MIKYIQEEMKKNKVVFDSIESIKEKPKVMQHVYFSCLDIIIDCVTKFESEEIITSKRKTQEVGDMLINQILQRDGGKYCVTKLVIISQHPSDVVLGQASESLLKIVGSLPLQNPSHKGFQLDLNFSQSYENLEQIVTLGFMAGSSTPKSQFF